MKITYIGHSGVMVEAESACLLFDCVAKEEQVTELDYAPGVWPELPKDKPIVFFASHRHQDHYSHDIWEFRKKLPDVSYVLAWEIPFSLGVRTRIGLTEEELAKVYRLKAHETQEISVGETKMVVTTLDSTDCGVAYHVTIDGHTIFHVGDLHNWAWEEGGDEYCVPMKKAFDKERVLMEGKEAEVAFLILDPRLENTAFHGIDAWLETMEFGHIFPIHQWKQYDLTDKYKKTREGKPENGILHRIHHENEAFEI